MLSGSPKIEIKFDQPSKTYQMGMNISGYVLVKSCAEFRHEGIELVVEGTVYAANQSESCLITKFLRIDDQLVSSGGRLTGETSYPFKYHLKSDSECKPLFETYHGVLFTVRYTASVTVRRPFPSARIEKNVEFYVESKPNGENLPTQPVAFSITPELPTHSSSVGLNDSSNQKADLKVTGRLNSTTIMLGSRHRTAELIGELTINDSSTLKLISIDVSILRDEAYGLLKDNVNIRKDCSEVQQTQIADGDVCCGLAIPIYVRLPALFTCASVESSSFKIAYLAVIQFTFADSTKVVKKFPISLIR